MSHRLTSKIPAVIIAAGKGTRLREIHGGTPKCLTEIAGKPIIEWIIRGFLDCGIAHLIIVIGYKRDYIKRYIDKNLDLDVDIEYIFNTNFEQPNGISAFLGAEHALKSSEKFILTMSDHLMDSVIIRKAIDCDTNKPLLMIDTNISSVFDIDDATKVEFKGDTPTEIGKELAKYSAVDTGLFRGNAAFIKALRESIGNGKESLSDGVKLLMDSSNFAVIPIPENARWIDVDTPGALARAGKMIREESFLLSIEKNSFQN